MHISAEYRHLGNFKESCFLLQELEKDQMPSEILDSLLKCVKSIYVTASQLSPKSALAGDELLPILIYISVRSDLVRPFTKCALAWDLCDPEQLQSESGYYLTVFESALSWIADYKEQ